MTEHTPTATLIVGRSWPTDDGSESKAIKFAPRTGLFVNVMTGRRFAIAVGWNAIELERGAIGEAAAGEFNRLDFQRVMVRLREGNN